MRSSRTIPLVVLCAFLSGIAAPSAEAARDLRKLYTSLCAGCHGPDLNGGSASSLVDDDWQHGSADADLLASIRDGLPGAGMPSFGETVSESELRGLVVLIREQAGRSADRQAKATRPDHESVMRSKHHAFGVETAIAGLHEPWSIAFLPDGRTLVTEKRGTLRIVENDTLNPEPISGIPDVSASGQAGLFDVVPHPDFARNGWIYLAFAEPTKSNTGSILDMTTVVRGRIKDGSWGDQEVVYRATPETFRRRGGAHYGGRLAFDREGYLFFAIGDRGQSNDAQNLARPNGKIHRVHDDGRIPSDNPFVNTPNALPSIWSYGHRNPQGLRFDPVTQALWSHEHGPRGGDELNYIQRGLNYGWPLATHGMNYNGTPMNAVTTRSDIEPSAVVWVPSIAPCGMGFYQGDGFPKWRNHLFVTSLAAQKLIRLELKGHQVIEQETIFSGLGRLRDVATGPDGIIYVLLPDRVARLVPASR